MTEFIPLPAQVEAAISCYPYAVDPRVHPARHSTEFAGFLPYIATPEAGDTRYRGNAVIGRSCTHNALAMVYGQDDPSFGGNPRITHFRDVNRAINSGFSALMIGYSEGGTGDVTVHAELYADEALFTEEARQGFAASGLALLLAIAKARKQFMTSRHLPQQQKTRVQDILRLGYSPQDIASFLEYSHIDFADTTLGLVLTASPEAADAALASLQE